MTEQEQAQQPEQIPEDNTQVSQQGFSARPESEQQQMNQVESSKDARNMAMLCHLLGAAGFIAPLIIWLSERDKHRFVNEHGRTAINYQISIMIYYFISMLLIPIIIGILMLAVLAVLHIVFVIMGTLKARAGLPWRYPIALKILQ